MIGVAHPRNRSSRWHKAGWLCVVVLTVVAGAVTSSRQGAAASPSARVVLVGPTPDHPTIGRLRDELSLLGFEIQVLPPSAGAIDLALLAQREHAAAAARVEEWPPEIVIWVAPEATGSAAPADPEIRVSDSLIEPPEHELLALRAVELLHGKLLPVPPDPHSPTAVTPAAPPTATPTPVPSSEGGAPADEPTDPWDDAQDGRGGFLFGPALTLSPGGVPVVPHIRLSGSYRAIWRLGVEALAFIPITSSKVSAPEGSMDLRTVTFGAAATMQLTPPDLDLRALAGLGLAATALMYEGQAVPPHAASEGSAWAAAPFAEFAVSYALHPVVAVRLDGIAALLLPEPVLRIADREVASYGRPAVLVTLGVEIRP